MQGRFHGEIVVCYNAKILICKQFTTAEAEKAHQRKLFAIMQRY